MEKEDNFVINKKQEDSDDAQTGDVVAAIEKIKEANLETDNISPYSNPYVMSRFLDRTYTFSWDQKHSLMVVLVWPYIPPGSRPPALSVSDADNQARSGHGQSSVPTPSSQIFVSDSPSFFASSAILIRSFLGKKNHKFTTEEVKIKKNTTPDFCVEAVNLIIPIIVCLKFCLVIDF
ncbi:hypothetical protein HAX54_003111 [Datura stramonium]|uniref:Uncharacterized protein n=1 Tax=Datura stramonium TaxID=4076 RepID=A0ABS8RTA7_DATST|nr:hypothetical protein [Datura stramonium]